MLVRPYTEGNYQIIGGHTRYQAAKMAGLEKVLCVVEEMDDDTAILRIGQDNLNDPFSWFSQCIYVAQNSVKDSKKGLSRTALIRSITGKEGSAASTEGARKGDVGEFLLWLEERSLLWGEEGFFLDPEVNLTCHINAIRRTPQKYWQQLTELLIENKWSVRQTEAITKNVIENGLHGFYPELLGTNEQDDSEPMVYFMQCMEFIKIGKAQFPQIRLQQLQAGNPFPITILLTINADERQTHQQFIKYHHSGEWFRREGKLHEFLESHGV